MRIENGGRAIETAEMAVPLTAEQSVMVEVLDALEDGEESARAARRAAQASRRAENAARLQNMRAAADQQLTASLVGAATKATTGTIGALTAGSPRETRERWGGVSEGVEGTGDAIQALIARGAKEHDLAATRHETLAQDHGERAEELGDDVRRAQSLQDRTLGHIDQVQQARMQAQVAAVRG